MPLLRKIKQTFALQLVVFLFFFSLLIFLAMFFGNSIMTRKVMFKNAEQMARSLTAEKINKIEGILSNIENISQNIAFLVGLDILDEGNHKDYYQKLINPAGEVLAISVLYTPEYLKSNPGANSVMHYLRDGMFYEMDVTDSATEYKTDDWFIIPVARQRAYWSEPWVNSKIWIEPITSYSVPIQRFGEIIGVVRTDISLKVLQRIVTSTHLMNSGYAILLTSNGTFVTHPADSLILNYTIFSYATQLKTPVLWQVGRNMVKGKSGFVWVPSSKDYPAKWIYYAPISLNKWSIGIKFAEKDIMGDLNQVNYIFSFILGLGLLMLLVSIYTRVTTIFKPLNLLVEATNEIGAGDFNVHLPESRNQNEVSLLTDSFAKMQSELKSYMENLIKTNREKDKISAEIKFAAQIQQRIIPSNQNLLTDVREVSIYGILEPAEDIGGDLYDAFMIDERFLCFAIADVFGKGIVASMLMTMVQTLIRSQSRYSNSAVSLVQEVNSYLCKNNKQANFITIIVGILDLKTGLVEFCNAGHTPLYHKKADQQCIRYSETHSTALGIFDDLKIESAQIQMDAQDYLILFTDGITEAMSAQEAFFGLDRMEDIISQMQNPTPEGIARSIISEVRKFTGLATQNDDLSILVLKFNHPRA
jgi:phosphoserine phosphatase RsbU/P